MAVQLPTPLQLLDVANEISGSISLMMMSPHSLAVLGPNIAAYNVVDSMVDNLPTVRFPRTPGRPAMRTRTSPQ